MITCELVKEGVPVSSQRRCTHKCSSVFHVPTVYESERSVETPETTVTFNPWCFGNSVLLLSLILPLQVCLVKLLCHTHLSFQSHNALSTRTSYSKPSSAHKHRSLLQHCGAGSQHPPSSTSQVPSQLSPSRRPQLLFSKALHKAKNNDENVKIWKQVPSNKSEVNRGGVQCPRHGIQQHQRSESVRPPTLSDRRSSKNCKVI